MDPGSGVETCMPGAYLRDFTAGEQSAQQQDAAMAARLWAVSRELVARNA